MNDSSAPIRISLLKLLELANGNQYVIPVYQRKYTWEANKEVKQFLNDLEKIVNGEYQNHFLGIFIQLDTPKGIGRMESYVVDGQQRLTTLFLTMYAIKQLLNDEGQIGEAKLIEKKYLTNDVDVYGVDRKYRLKPLVSDDDVYKNVVEGKLDLIVDKNSNILTNYLYIVAHLKELLIKGKNIENILDAMNRLYVVSIPITNDDNPQRIFESINATGVKLTAADLIRNYLLMDLESDIQEKYYFEYWKTIEKLVSNDSKVLESFFRFYLAIKKHELVSKNNVYREFVYWIESVDIKTKELFKELVQYSGYYNDLKFKELKNVDEKLKTELSDYRKFNSDLTMPLMLEFYKWYKNDLFNTRVLTSLIHSLNTYMIRRSLCDLNSQNISRLFPTILKKIGEKCGNDYSKVLDVLNRELVLNTINTSGSYMPNDKQMYELLNNANVYGRPALRIVLDRLELHNNPAPVDLSSLSIEHLMPQTGTPDWYEELDVDVTTYSENLHRLGNLTLASKPDNSKMKNLTWDYKNKILENTSHLTLNKEIISIEKWDLKCIDKRTKELINKICDIYEYPDIDALVEDDGVDAGEAIDITLNKLNSINKLKCIRQDKLYLSIDEEKTYFLTHSKRYAQKDKNQYWFTFRKEDFDMLHKFNNPHLALTCRGDEATTVLFPLSYIDGNIDNLNTASDNRTIKIHVKINIYPDGMISLQLPKPIKREVDISQYLI